ncbi:hypothetical protein PQR75_26250 [Paraburkholderia fungorum]|uniref:hypothetical protein n=1 Tax=Paraburkholderia fungorum TaxID=134537 RepID=UPI0038BBC8A0
MDNAAPSPSEIAAVANRCEQTFHGVTALHDLVNLAICRHSDDRFDDNTIYMILREGLRAIARDMENCAEILEGDPGGLGYFAAAYGSV